MSGRVGLWLIGARGAVASVVSLGLVATSRKLTGDAGLVTELEPFRSLDLIDWDQVVIGGHEIRCTDLLADIREFQASSRAFDCQLVDACAEGINTINERIHSGIISREGQAIESLADPKIIADKRTPLEKIEAVKTDFAEFKKSNQLDRVVVINLASTEPSTDLDAIPETWSAAQPLLETSETNPFPASSLYAIAAIQSGHAYINFTPSLGSNCQPIMELAEQHGAPHAGQDGKTGETLIKSALAPIFANRNLPVMSWVGHNIFGNRDGQVLDDPANKSNKVASKDRLLGEILGYHPQSHISIEYIKSLGDWKTAWDHIHFQGFLGTPMTMQFIWQGCDSMLAAPLVLDLFRLTDLAVRQGHTGNMDFLACFFKSPIGVEENNFIKQFQMLESWAEK